MVEEEFREVRVSRWRQFEDVSLDLSGQLTILTGENGTGKSTILTVLANQFDRHSFPYIASPDSSNSNVRLDETREHNSDAISIEPSVARITFGSGQVSVVSVRQGREPEYVLDYRPGVTLPGIFLDSHRVLAGYQKVRNIPAKFSEPRELAEEYTKLVRSQQNSTFSGKSPSLALKESLLAAALYAEGNRFVRADPVAGGVWSGFQRVLTLLFPDSLGFLNLAVERGEVLVETRSGAFALEAASGGLAAVVDLAWQIFLAAHTERVFTVCFDEPENHLHPSLQRSLLPSLLEAFPTVRFIVATHSPFVVSSVKNARVYALRRGARGVVSELLDFENQAVAADEILRDVLGVESTLPQWAEVELSAIIDRFEKEPFSAENAQAMQAALRKSGLRFTFPEVLPEILPKQS